ncbi:MAG: alpha/beta fold hydrolase [Planctomycetaceae bacterium]
MHAHTAEPCSEAQPAESIEPCPPPLAWQEVLQRFRADAKAWELSRGSYTLRGKTWGTGQPLYFLNGLTGNSELFSLLVWLLKDDYRCVLFDYPEHSARNRDGRRLTLSDYVDDLLAVADGQSDAAFSIYATSFGVPLALKTMSTAPARIERVILQGGDAWFPLTWFERLMIQCGRLIPGKVRHIPGRHTVWKQNHLPWFPPFDQTRWSFLDDVTGENSIRTIAHRLSLMHQHDLRPDLPRIVQPVLLIGTEGEGPRLGSRREELATRLPRSETQLLDSMGLFPFLTHPHRLKKIMHPFLSPT